MKPRGEMKKGIVQILFNEFRCKQPYIALILWVGFGMASITSATIGYRTIKEFEMFKAASNMRMNSDGYVAGYLCDERP